MGYVGLKVISHGVTETDLADIPDERIFAHISFNLDEEPMDDGYIGSITIQLSDTPSCTPLKNFVVIPITKGQAKAIHLHLSP